MIALRKNMVDLLHNNDGFRRCPPLSLRAERPPCYAPVMMSSNAGTYTHAIASKYDRLRSWRGKVPERIAERLRLHGASRLLDIACGTGNLGMALHAIVPCSVVGADLSRDMIRRAAAKMAHALFVQANAVSLPFAAGSFDAMAGAFFLHHIAPDKRPAFFRESRRVLGEGRLALVTTSHADIAGNPMARFFEGFVEIDRARFPDIPEILGWMERAGFGEAGAERISDGSRMIDAAYADRVAQKPITTLDLLSEESFRQGMERLREYVQKTQERPDAVERCFTVVYGRAGL